MALLFSILLVLVCSFDWFEEVPVPLLSLPLQTSWRLLITPNVSCSEDPPFVALATMTAAADFEGRERVRNTWGGVGIVNGRRVRLFFVLGAVASKSVQEAVEAEAAWHGDILQHAAPEKYTHLTYKTITLIQWLARSCPQANFLVKADGDVLLDLNKIVAYLTAKQHEPNVAAGFVRVNNPVLRYRSHRNYEDPFVYPHPTYPLYPAGPCYMLSGALVGKIAEVAVALPRLNNEDCFIGLCLQRLGVEPQDSAPQAPINPEFDDAQGINEVMKWAAVHPVRPTRFLPLWNDMQSVGLRSATVP